jgi:hypothetical protein
LINTRFFFFQKNMADKHIGYIDEMGAEQTPADTNQLSNAQGGASQTGSDTNQLSSAQGGASQTGSDTNQLSSAQGGASQTGSDTNQAAIPAVRPVPNWVWEYPPELLAMGYTNTPTTIPGPR